MICIYHGGCTDGVAAAWALWKNNPVCSFYPGVYQNDPPFELIEDDDVFLVDFSYKHSVIKEICKQAKSVTILDHHKTAKNDLIPLLESGRVHGVFDMNRCGALITWDYLHSRPPPKLLQEIDAQDRWLPSRDSELIMALRSYPHKPVDDTPGAWLTLMRQWDWLMSDEGFKELKKDGFAIHRYYQQRVDETKHHAGTMRMGGYENIPVVNAPYYLASDVAGDLAKNAPDGIAAVWWCNKDGSVTFSLRSRGDVDVGELAEKLYGGGGHPGAAGFKVGGVVKLLTMIDWLHRAAGEE